MPNGIIHPVNAVNSTAEHLQYCLLGTLNSTSVIIFILFNFFMRKPIKKLLTFYLFLFYQGATNFLAGQCIFLSDFEDLCSHLIHYDRKWQYNMIAAYFIQTIRVMFTLRNMSIQGFQSNTTGVIIKNFRLSYNIRFHDSH